MKSLVNKLANFIRGNFERIRGDWQRRRYLSRHREPEPDIPRSEWKDSLESPTEFYLRCLRLFTTSTSFPKELLAHRTFFKQSGRGFGEDVFHVMWLLLFREFRPANFLEIGVYRGQTLSLAGLLARLLAIPCLPCGISPFSAAGDSVSKYQKGIDYLEDTRANVAHFALSEPVLLKAFSTDEAAVALISSRRWDCIFIDGNHDYEVAKQDWEICAKHLRDGGIIVLDDSGLSTKYEPPLFATGGHPGPSRVAWEIDPQRFQEILQVGHNRVFQKWFE